MKIECWVKNNIMSEYNVYFLLSDIKQTPGEGFQEDTKPGRLVRRITCLPLTAEVAGRRWLYSRLPAFLWMVL